MSQTTLITGATSGIGYELTKKYAADGYNLVLTARTQFKLEHIAQELADAYSIEVHIVPDDLSDPDAPQRIYAYTKKHNIHIDVLVNNAGFGLRGAFAETNLSTELDMITVNISALTELTKLFVEDMIRENSGHIVNIASTAAFLPGAYMAVYYATKAYVLHFGEAIREELKKTGVKVTTVCPGPTSTGFEQAADIEFSQTMKVMSVEEAVDIAYRDIQKKKSISILGRQNKTAALLTRIAPYKLLTKITARLQQRPARDPFAK